MANNEIHIKDFWDIDESFKWIDEVSADYDEELWSRYVEVRLLSSGATQIMVSFKLAQPDLFDEDTLDSDVDFNDFGN